MQFVAAPLTSAQDVCICPWEGANDLMTGVWAHPGWKGECVFSFKPQPKLPPSPTFPPATTPNTQTSLCLGKFPCVLADIIARSVLRRRQQPNHTRFWQAVMEMLEAAPSLWLPDYMVHTGCCLCCGRWLTKPLWLVPPPSDSNPAQTLQSLFWKVLVCVVHLYTFLSTPAQLSQLFSVLFQSHRGCLPQPHPSLHQQQTKVCPSEVLCAVLTTVNAQGFMLYFGGEDIPPFQVCEVFSSLSEVQLSWSAHCRKSCFECIVVD